MRDFSVIIPTHNRVNYLSRSLNSVLNQTYENFEIILIDDCSIDGTYEFICDNYDKSYIKYFKVNFNDISKTRNYALSKIVGDTIVFVDSDDWIEQDLFEKLNEQNKKNDVIRYQAIMLDDDGKVVEQFITSSFQNKKGINVLNEFVKNYEIYSPLWLYAYSADFWKKQNFKFPIGKLQEDFAITSLVLNNSNCVSSIPYIGYNYYKNPDGIMRNTNYQNQVKKAYDVLYHCDEFYKKIVLNQSDSIIKNNLINYYIGVLENKVKILKGEEKAKYSKELLLRKKTWR